MYTIPKYLCIVNWVKEKIVCGELKSGDVLYSEKKICELFNASRQTVRSALYILEQDNLIIRKKGSGTFLSFNRVDSNIAQKKICVISTYVGEYVFTNVLYNIESVLSKNGYAMQLSITGNKIENEKRILESVVNSDVAGLIVEPTKSALPNPNMHLYHEIAKRGIPIVFLNAIYPSQDFHVVALDDVAAGKEATKYLIEKGHKKIAGLFQSDDIQGHLRYKGFVEALSEANLQIIAENIVWFATEDIEELSMYPKRLTNRFQDCTAVVCYNDKLAMLVAKVFQKMNINVPCDFSIVGIDNSSLAETNEIPITSVENPVSLLGQTAAKNILELIKEPSYNATKLFAPKIIERDSVYDILQQNKEEFVL